MSYPLIEFVFYLLLTSQKIHLIFIYYTNQTLETKNEAVNASFFVISNHLFNN